MNIYISYFVGLLYYYQYYSICNTCILINLFLFRDLLEYTMNIHVQELQDSVFSPALGSSILALTKTRHPHHGWGIFFNYRLVDARKWHF